MSLRYRECEPKTAREFVVLLRAIKMLEPAVFPSYTDGFEDEVVHVLCTSVAVNKNQFDCRARIYPGGPRYEGTFKFDRRTKWFVANMHIMPQDRDNIDRETQTRVLRETVILVVPSHSKELMPLSYDTMEKVNADLSGGYRFP